MKKLSTETRRNAIHGKTKLKNNAKIKIHSTSCGNQRSTQNNAKINTELKAIWKDPEFVHMDKSFYYVRVLENPTCRWSTWDAIKSGYKPREDLHETIQERAWSSPIWYIPEPTEVDVIPLGGTLELRDLN